MSTDPVPSLALPAPATSAATATSLTQSAALPTPEQAPSTTSQKLLPSVAPQSIPSQQQPPPQHVTANHPASIAAAATVALSATLLNPNEWNALASTSMVTLDDLRSAFLEQRQQQLKDMERTHRESLRELLFMSETFDKEEIAGSPWKLGQTLQVSEDDAREHVKSFLDQHHLALDMKKSIKDHVLEQPKLIRQRVSQELKTGPIEVAPPPTPTSATPAGEVQRDRDLRREVEQSNLHRSQAVARAAAAVQARAIAEGVAKIKPLTITAAETQGVRVAPLQPGQVPSFVIESPTPIPPILSGIDSSATGSVDANTQNLDVQAAIPAVQTSTPTIKVESTDTRDASPSKSSSALERAVSPVPGLARNASSQSTSLRVPPSPMVVPTVPENIVAPPLHPTLQVLAPNPLSVTYAASLRPLPPDPTRRITGAGVSGGAIHHRSGRKLASSLSHSNANSYSSIAAAKIGPAGSGQTDLYRWYVRARASPGAGMVGKADKCLMTSDWKVAFNEQRFVRAMARIEKLKAQGEWSFRQPKKQKGPVVRKSHWDHLLEEMKWLQTDFREERRWKMTVAFHLAHEVAAWHRARSAAERAAFCVSVQRPYRRRTVSENVEQRATEEAVDDVEMPDSTSSTQVESNADATIKDAESVQPARDADVTMDGAEEADEAVSQAIENALETTDQAADARLEMDADRQDDEADADADDVEAATAALVSGEPAKPPVVQVVREPLPQPEPMPALSAAPVSMEKQSTSALPAHTEGTAADDGKLANALRSEPQDADSTLTAELPPQLLATLRAPIFSTSVTTTIVSPAALLESLDPEAAAALLGIEVGDLSNAADLLEPGSLSFSKMFPELPLYGGVSLPDSNSKSDRRWDEGSLNQPPRLTHVTKLLDSRPLLVSTLEPSKNRANGRWLPDSDWIVAAEQSDPLRGVADGTDAGLPPLPGSLLFARKSNRAAKDASGPVSTTPAEPTQSDARAALFMWTSDEDNYLMTLAKQYHNNWALVADLFNSTRLNTATDTREPWDCYDRCKRIEQAAAEGKPPPGPPPMPAPAADADKDGKKGDGKDGDASNGKRDKLSKKMGSKYDGSKRKQRRSNLMEVMRKSAKRREASKQAQQTQQTKKVNLNTHETHAQIKAGPAITPQSLSALKNERDQAALRQFYEQQRAQMAYQQQQQQQQRLLAQQAQAQRMAQQQAGASTPGQAAAPAAQAGKPGAAAAAGAANLTLPIGSTSAALPGATAQAQQNNVAGAASQQGVQQTPQQQAQQPAAAQMQAQQSQQQPTQQQQQQVQAQLQSQLQASQAAQMQTLYAQIQQQQQQQQQRQQTQQLNQAANLPQVRPAVGPLTQQQLATLTPQQQQQYHAQLAAATAAAAQQQQLRNQMAAVAAAQQGGQIPMNQFQLMQQQQQQQQGRPMQNSQQQQQQQQQQAAAALQMYQQQQRQAAQVQAQAQMRAPNAAQAQQFAARPGGTPRPASGGKQGAQGRPSPSPQPGGMPATVQALQQQLAISLATSNLSPEQINGLAIQLYKQAQQQGSTNQAAGASGVRPPAAAAAAGAGAAGRPPQQVLNQAIQALAAQNQKSQQQAGAAGAGQNGAAAATGNAGGSPVRPPTPRPS